MNRRCDQAAAVSPAYVQSYPAAAASWRGALLLLLCCCGAAASAKELYLIPSAGLRTEYDDNKRLWSDRLKNGIDTSAYGVIASASAEAGVRGDRYAVSLDNRLEIRRYASDLDLDSENVYLDLASSFNATQRSLFGLDGNYTRDTTLTSELEATGLVQDNVVREQWYLRPYWSYFLSDATILQADYSHYDTAYERSTINRFFDYTTDAVSLTVSRQWSELLKNYLSVSWMSFEVPELRRQTTQYTVNLGLDYQFLPTWSASLSVGRRFTNTEITFDQPVLVNGFFVIVDGALLTTETTISDDVQGMVFSFGLSKQFLAGSAGLSYSRATSAQGNGRLQLLDRFSANYDQNVTQHLRLSLNGGINVTTTSGGQNDFNDRTYYYVRPSVSWLFDRHARVTAGYMYRTQSYDNQNNDTAASNAFFIGFNYQWDRMATQKY